MPDPIATSADYADAMIVARRAKNWLFLILLIMLLVQLAMFFIARYTTLIIIGGGTTTQPVVSPWLDRLHYLSGVSTFLGTLLPPLLGAVLLLIVNIMLIGRLIGVARVTGAFVWCLLLVLMLFPWQAFLNNANFSAAEFKIPGVLYTWDELVLSAKFQPARIEERILKWARFLVFPLIALIVLMIVQVKSNRGLRQALGEADPDLGEPEINA
ncbi:MAG TPA: hypothetical protein VER17_08795 [Tepidisphaeraceae bacterium]|nr:hypothetical protein [Tepidisphaeraceae bacterium]